MSKLSMGNSFFVQLKNLKTILFALRIAKKFSPNFKKSEKLCFLDKFV